MAVTTTPLGFKAPDGNELVRNGDNAIAENAWKAEDLHAAAATTIANLSSRLGQVEANGGGSGSGHGLSEDPLNPGTYFIADASPLTEDPLSPGLYNF